jgi:hypothetical protein
MLSITEHPFPVTGSEQLPSPLRAVYSGAPGKDGCRLAIYAPVPSARLWRQGPTAGNLLMVFDSHMLIASWREGKEVETVRILFPALLCVEIGVILLSAWMRVIFDAGLVSNINIPFNAVGADYFLAAHSFVRRAIDRRPHTKVAASPGVIDLPLKFRNALRHWLAPGETVIDLVFQPELRARRLGILERQVVPPLLAALTDRQVLLIAEEPAKTRAALEKYSEVSIYCPLSRVDSLTLAPHGADRELADFTVALVNGDARFPITSVVGEAQVPEFERYCHSVRSYVEKRRMSDACILINR